ncbi:MAG UNVERIFIED_CONTAM: hypothetical protein LVR18_22455 [Planctomycetaceae bacterium]
MEVSDRVLLVTQLDLSCLRNVIRILQFLDHYPSIRGKVEIVVNRVGLEDCDISLNKALDAIGRSVFWQLPNDYAVMAGSRNNGVPLCQFAATSKTHTQPPGHGPQTHRSGRAHSCTRGGARKRGLFGLFAGRQN